MKKNSVKCLNCNKTILPSDKYCIYCGERTNKYKICPVCNKTVLSSDKFCIYCGTKITDYKKCVVCDKTILQSDKYCIYCGEYQSNYKLCINCNETILHSDNYCIYCGKKQNQSYKKINYVNDHANNINSHTKQFEEIKKNINESEELRDDNSLETKIPKILICMFTSIIAIGIIVYLVFFRSYKINYINMDGAINTNPSSYYRTSDYIKLEIPVKEGYEFEGWYADQYYTKSVKGINSGSSGEITLYAKWSEKLYKITYFLTNGTNNFSNPDYYTINSETIVLKEPTRKGYEFVGWYSGDEKITSIEKGSTGDIILDAKWNANTNRITYYYTYDASNPNPTEIAVDEEIYLRDISSTRTGYDFGGWSTEYGEKVTKIKGTGDDIKLYANWNAIEYSISYSGVFSNNYNPKKYSSTSYFYLEEPYRNDNGYSFDGWYDDYGNQVIYVGNGMTGNIHLTARWRAKTFFVEYRDTYGASNSNPTQYTADSTVYLNDIYRDGYTFEGWYDAYGVKYTYISGSKCEDFVLYARWSQNS